VIQSVAVAGGDVGHAASPTDLGQLLP